MIVQRGLILKARRTAKCMNCCRRGTDHRMAFDISTDPKLEALTRDYGREIFARVGHTGPVPFSLSWWDDRLMNWTMADEAVKLQLFRFIDVLPLLHSPREVNRHLREYFQEAERHLPGW